MGGNIVYSPSVTRPPQSPAWRSSMAAWEWKELTSADFSACLPSVAPGGSTANRLQWSGFVAIGTKLCAAGIGGHADWAGNEAYSCELNTTSPTWSLLREPTASGLVIADANYYADGRPTSSHTYYTLHPDEARNKIFRFGVGSAWGSGPYTNAKVDAFNLSTNDWDAAGTWADVPATYTRNQPQAFDYVTGDRYAVNGTGLHRWNTSGATWTSRAGVPGGDANRYYAHASCVDNGRGRFVVFGDATLGGTVIGIFDTAGNSWSTATSLSGARATEAVATELMAWHHTPSDTYLIKTPTADDVIQVSPTWVATTRSTTGGSSIPSVTGGSGLLQRMTPVPSLGGIAYQPMPTSKLWFLATQ